MIAAFAADLLAGDVATRVLEAWSGGRVHAEVEAGVVVPASPGTRMRLEVTADAPLGFRRVRLMRGTVILSRADNWFVADRLTPEMRDALTRSDTPFGVVIAALVPQRQTLECAQLAGDPVLRVSALVRTGDGRPLAEVVEHYAQAAMVGRPVDPDLCCITSGDGRT